MYITTKTNRSIFVIARIAFQSQNQEHRHDCHDWGISYTLNTWHADLSQTGVTRPNLSKWWQFTGYVDELDGLVCSIEVFHQPPNATQHNGCARWMWSQHSSIIRTNVFGRQTFSGLRPIYGLLLLLLTKYYFTVTLSWITLQGTLHKFMEKKRNETKCSKVKLELLS